MKTDVVRSARRRPLAERTDAASLGDDDATDDRAMSAAPPPPHPSSATTAPPCRASSRAGHRLRRRTSTVVNYVEDAYLRDDVPCGCPLCETCDNATASGVGTPLGGVWVGGGAGEATTHYLVPDARAIARWLDFLESPAGAVRSIHWSPYDRVRVVNADP